MASLNVFFPAIPTQRRSLPSSSFKTFATAANSSSAGKSSSSEEKSFLDFMLGSLQKEDQFYETDPILKKVEDATATVSGKKIQSAAAAAGNNNGGGFGLGGLFSKK